MSARCKPKLPRALGLALLGEADCRLTSQLLLATCNLGFLPKSLCHEQVSYLAFARSWWDCWIFYSPSGWQYSPEHAYRLMMSPTAVYQYGKGHCSSRLAGTYNSSRRTPAISLRLRMRDLGRTKLKGPPDLLPIQVTTRYFLKQRIPWLSSGSPWLSGKHTRVLQGHCHLFWGPWDRLYIGTLETSRRARLLLLKGCVCHISLPCSGGNIQIGLGHFLLSSRLCWSNTSSVCQF